MFVVAARVIGRLLREAGAHTRLPLNVATILGRLVSTGVTILGIFVAAVVIFPAFQPGDDAACTRTLLAYANAASQARRFRELHSVLERLNRDYLRTNQAKIANQRYCVKDG